jgi:hypothetical protein
VNGVTKRRNSKLFRIVNLYVLIICLFCLLVKVGGWRNPLRGVMFGMLNCII